MRSPIRPLLLLPLIAAGCAASAPAPEPKTVLADKQLQDAPYASALPQFSLEDPRGVAHVRSELRHGAVLLVTAPTLDESDAQQAWNDALKQTQPDGTDAHYVLLQDMTPSWFEEEARERMEEQDAPHQPPLLLIDPDGELREALGVGEDETVVLVYGPSGALRDHEAGEASTARAEQLWAALLAD